MGMPASSCRGSRVATHSHTEASVATNRSNTIVPMWLLIVNDSVVGYAGRYVQAKCHEWGLTEVAWAMASYNYMPFQVWAPLMAFMQAQWTPVLPESLLVFCPSLWTSILSLHTSTLWVIVGVGGTYITVWTAVMLVDELFLWHRVLPHNPAPRGERWRATLPCCHAPHTLLMSNHLVASTAGPGEHATIPCARARVDDNALGVYHRTQGAAHN